MVADGCRTIRHCLCNRRRSSSSCPPRRQLLRRVFRQRPVHGQRNRVVHAVQHEPVCGNGLGHGEVDALIVVVMQRAQSLKCGGARLAERVHVKVELELRRVRCSESDAARKVCLNPGAERDDADLVDDDGVGELHEVQVELGLQIMAEGVEEEELLRLRVMMVQMGHLHYSRLQRGRRVKMEELVT
jgi:hypothetical protein